MRVPLLLILTLVSLRAETPAEKKERLAWYHEAKFGLFIHWGLYSIPAGTWRGRRVPGIGEWIMNYGKIPMKDYQALAAQFNPVKFDADAWVRAAKGAGMRYIVITSKHHDGFAMFKSEASAFNIYDATPFHRDPLAELAAACRKEGLRLGFYYSQAQDWNHPGGAAANGHWDPAQNGSMDHYIATVAVPQVREILTHYGKISILWWDTPRDMTPERAAPLAALLKLQPGIITNNRLGGGYMGDTETPEQRIPAKGYPGDWESCMTMNDTWGYKSYDHNWKSAQTLVRNLIDVVSKGGNYLLNVGPTSEGLIPEASLERLQAIGTWTSRYGESIYGATASPFDGLAWGRATSKPGKLYLHVFDWPEDGRLVVPMRSGISRAYLLGAGTDLQGGRRPPGDGSSADDAAFRRPEVDGHLKHGRLEKASLSHEQTPDGLVLHVPTQAPNPWASVIVLDLSEPVDALPAPLPQPGKDGVLRLACDSGQITGPSLRVEGNLLADLTDWKVPDAVAWKVRLNRPGRYRVTLNYLVPEGQGGSTFGLTASTDKKTPVGDVHSDYVMMGKTVETGGDYKDLSAGTVEISAAGPAQITLRPTRIAHDDLFKLRSVTLSPE